MKVHKRIDRVTPFIEVTDVSELFTVAEVHKNPNRDPSSDLLYLGLRTGICKSPLKFIYVKPTPEFLAELQKVSIFDVNCNIDRNHSLCLGGLLNPNVLSLRFQKISGSYALAELPPEFIDNLLKEVYPEEFGQ